MPAHHQVGSGFDEALESKRIVWAKPVERVMKDRDAQSAVSRVIGGWHCLLREIKTRRSFWILGQPCGVEAVEADRIRSYSEDPIVKELLARFGIKLTFIFRRK